MLLTISRIASMVLVLGLLLSCGGSEDSVTVSSTDERKQALNASASTSVMDVQLPFVEGAAYRCTQNSYDTPTHNGPYTKYDLDFGMPVGTVVVAAAEGIMRRRSHPSGFGTYARVDHDNGKWTMYAHLSGFIARDGDRVYPGQPIAYSGNTGEASTAPHLHFGVHQGDGVGESVPMRVKAYNRDTRIDGWFRTGDSSTTQFKCDTSTVIRDGHRYEVSYFGPTFNDYRCVALSGTNGVLCWNRNPVECVDGENHVRYFKNNEGATVSEQVSRHAWCVAGTGQQVDVVAYLEGGYGVGGVGPGGYRDPTDPPTPGLPDFITESIKAYDASGVERYAYLQTERLRVHHITGNTGDADWAGDQDDMYVTLFLSKGYKEDAHSEWKRVGTAQIKKDNIRVGDHKDEHFDIDLRTLNDGLALDPGTYNLVGCPDRKYDDDNGDGEVPEKHKSNNCSTELVFTVEADPSYVVPRPDLVPYAFSFLQTPTYAGDWARFAASIRNQGNFRLSSDIRSTYSVSCNGGPEVILTDDGTAADELEPGEIMTESTDSPVRLPDVFGTCTAYFRVDIGGTAAESDETNNTASLTFTLLPRPLPDLIITYIEIDPWPDDSIQKGKTHHPTMKIKNVGTGPMTSGIRSAYYWKGPSTGYAWRQIADDGTDVQELCVGCEVTETIDSGFKESSQKGTYYLMACADYQGNQSESNEGNNCMVSRAITVK